MRLQLTRRVVRARGVRRDEPAGAHPLHRHRQPHGHVQPRAEEGGTRGRVLQGRQGGRQLVRLSLRVRPGLREDGRARDRPRGEARERPVPDRLLPRQRDPVPALHALEVPHRLAEGPRQPARRAGVARRAQGTRRLRHARRDGGGPPRLRRALRGHLPRHRHAHPAEVRQEPHVPRLPLPHLGHRDAQPRLLQGPGNTWTSSPSITTTTGSPSRRT